MRRRAQQGDEVTWAEERGKDATRMRGRKARRLHRCWRAKAADVWSKFYPMATQLLQQCLVLPRRFHEPGANLSNRSKSEKKGRNEALGQDRRELKLEQRALISSLIASLSPHLMNLVAVLPLDSIISFWAWWNMKRLPLWLDPCCLFGQFAAWLIPHTFIEEIESWYVISVPRTCTKLVPRLHEISTWYCTDNCEIRYREIR